MNVTEEQFADLKRRVEANRMTAYENTSMVPMQLLKSPKRRKATSEAEIERACTQILIHDGWRHLKTDPVSRRAWGKGFGENGMADGLYLRYCACGNPTPAKPYSADAQVLWVEWKREDGTAAAHQLRWHERERAKGALTLIAGVDFPASTEGFAEWYGKSGLKRSVTP